MAKSSRCSQQRFMGADRQAFGAMDASFGNWAGGQRARRRAGGSSLLQEEEEPKSDAGRPPSRQAPVTHSES